MVKLSTLEAAASGEHGACSLTANSDSSPPKTAIRVFILLGRLALSRPEVNSSSSEIVPELHLLLGAFRPVVNLFSTSRITRAARTG